ncbi:MAG TPA: tryptophan synthase subunit alpha [Acidimicrobiia bacterium]|nr:tryptophan synthase subunit alpha [Acidimicrobiia bacterium]
MTGEGRRELDAMFVAAKGEDRAVLLPYLTAGLPTLDDSVDLFVAMAEAGADGFEVGIPYADPLMDGPVIMRAGELALKGGVTVEGSLEVVRRVRERTGKPTVVMTYVNPVLRHGVDDFFKRVADAGGSGVIIADLPVDESDPFVDAARAHGLGMVQFAAPTTEHDRLAAIASRDPVFVYAIADVGVTGERDGASTRIEALASAIRRVTKAPIVFGVGISTPEQAALAALHGDGVIVGTAIVRRVLDAGSASDARHALVEAVEGLATAVRRG